MIFYLNVMSRKSISEELNKSCKKRFNQAMVITGFVSVILFLCLMKFVMRQVFPPYWIFIIILMNLGVILMNMATVKLFISKTVNKKTSNDNISKITRS